MLGDYYLLCSNIRGLVINKEHWEREIFPGSKVSMSITIKTLFGNEGTCPRPGCTGKSGKIHDQQILSW